MDYVPNLGCGYDSGHLVYQVDLPGRDVHGLARLGQVLNFALTGGTSMRDILFRGKRVRNGEWVYGSLIAMDSEIDCNQVFIFPPIRGASSAPCETLVRLNMVAVDNKTIGQCTGLTDKNGKKIFEGDILDVQVRGIDEDDGHAIVEWGDECSRFSLAFAGMITDFDFVYGYECEVIGNIHDNPELLGDTNNGQP